MRTYTVLIIATGEKLSVKADNRTLAIFKVIDMGYARSEFDII